MSLPGTDSIAENLFDDRESMTATLAAEIAARLGRAIAARGRAAMVAAGGTTPAALHERLRRADIDWSRVVIVPSDDRQTKQHETGPNEARLRASLLRDDAGAARWQPLEGGDAALAALAPFDVTMLGMGTDGHIASLLPLAAGLADALDTRHRARVCPILPRDPASGARISLTLKAILDSRIVIVLIQGQDKLAAWRAARRNGDTMAMPVRALLAARRVPVALYWAP